MPIQTLFQSSVPEIQGVAAPTSFSLNFSGSENPLSQGGKFWNGKTDGVDWQDFQCVSGIACAGANSSTSQPPYDDAVAILLASAFTCTNDQYAEQTVHFVNGYNPPGTHEHGLFIGVTKSAHSIVGYEWYIGAGGSSAIVRWEGANGSFTPIINVNPAVPVEGTVRKLTRVGTLISAYENGVLLASGNDATYSGGQPGLQSYATSGATFGSYGSSSFRCGNL